MRHIRITLAILLFILPVSGFAEEAVVDSKKTLAELTVIITQYEARIKQLQSENDVLRYEMAKAGMKIPLVALSG
jgi:cell division protein FtsB